MPNEERSKFRGDVWYEVWRWGGNPDAIDDDRIDDCYDDGYYAEECAAVEVRRQCGSREEEEREEY